MAEESEPKKKSIMDNRKAKTFENGWIVCRSQKRSGLLYDFNISTGEAVWRDPDKITHHTAIMDKNKIPFVCHEPTEPPQDPKLHTQQNFTQSIPAPNVYNKQIINNQFPTKPFAIAPFGNVTCGPYSLIDPNNTISMNTMNPTPIWLSAPPTPQVLLPTGTTPNQVHTIYGNLENIQLQNSSVTLSNRFQVLNQLNTGSPIDVNLQEEENCQSYSQQLHNNYKHWHERNPQRPVNNIFKRHTDLRSKLSSRRRQDSETEGCDSKVAERESDNYNKDIPVTITEDDLNPDDNDEWLEAHTDGEGRELKVDMECFWDLADSTASRDCCYILPTMRVLLNNTRFLASLVVSDDRLRLLTPRDVVRTLRSAAFSSNSRLVDFASRARTFAIRQMRKFPDNLKDASNIKACLELIPPNIHVVRLVDDKDLLNQESINDGTITIAELKRFLARNSKPKPKSVPGMQDIKIVVNNGDIHESLPTPNAQPQIPINKAIEIQTDLSSPPGKRTANACVQTDFDFTISFSAINPNKNKTCESVNAADDSSDNQMHFNSTVTQNRPKEITLGSTEVPNDSIATTPAPRKIRLKRPQHAITNTGNTEEKKPFKWRRKKSTLQAQEVVECHQNTNISTFSTPPPSTSVSGQQNENSMDYKDGDVSAKAKMVDGSSTSGVRSNSIGSDTMFRINKQVIRNESKTDQNLVLYEITSDSMTDRLILRREEWISRFIQIMEEVLTQVLVMDPPYINATLPPPWTFYEATVCVKQKFIKETSVVDGADKLAVFLLKINDDRGNIETRISPTDFMQMYTFGVNLVNRLQMVLKDCEDLQIASQNLSNLLSDIREPNLDESYEDETFNYDEMAYNHSPNISELVTDKSTIVSSFPEISTPAHNESPKSKENSRSCNNSPARYSLRSSRSNSEKNKKKGEAGQTDVCSENKEYTLFSSLGLQKRDIKVDASIVKTILNSPKDQKTLPLKEAHNIALDNVQAGKTSDDAITEKSMITKIVRNFSICPEFENRLKLNKSKHAIDNDDPVENGYVAENHITENGGVDERDDFTGGNFTNYKPLDYGNDYGDMLETTNKEVDPSYESRSTQSDHFNSNGKLKKIVKRITYKYRRWLTDLRQFCEVTNETVRNADFHNHEFQANVMCKITKVGEHANNVCRSLKCILNRDPSVTRNKFREMFKSYGFIDFDMSDTQITEYRVMIEKYLELAERLLTCVTRLAEAVKGK